MMEFRLIESYIAGEYIEYNIYQCDKCSKEVSVQKGDEPFCCK